MTLGCSLSVRKLLWSPRCHFSPAQQSGVLTNQASGRRKTRQNSKVKASDLGFGQFRFYLLQRRPLSLSALRSQAERLIKFLGTVTLSPRLKDIREDATQPGEGHSVQGTGCSTPQTDVRAKASGTQGLILKASGRDRCKIALPLSVSSRLNWTLDFPKL